MPRPAKQAKLNTGEITYESLFGGDTKVISTKSPTDDSEKSDLSQCTDNDCKILDIAKVLRQKPSFSKNRHTMPITQPILVPLWHEPSNANTTEKTMYCVRGTDVDLNKLDENGLAGGSDSKPQIVYKVVPNTHAHVIRYVLAEDEQPPNDNEILEIVDITKDRRRVIRLSGKSDSIIEEKKMKKSRFVEGGNEDDVTGEHTAKTSITNSISQQIKPKLPTSKTPNQTKETTELRDKCRILELKCKWSDQKMAEMQSEMKLLKEEMLEIKRTQNSKSVVVQNSGEKLIFFAW